MADSFFKVACPDPPSGAKASLRRQLRSKTGDVLKLHRIVPILKGTTNGMRGYYCGRNGMCAVDRDGVSRIVREDFDRVWLA